MYELILNSNVTYNLLLCGNLCLQEIVQAKCQCFFTGFSILLNNHFSSKSFSPCINSTQLECFARLDFSSKLLSYADTCLAKCPRECESIKYETHLSSIDYPSIEDYNMFKNDLITFNLTQSLYENIDLSTFDLYKQYYYSIKVFYPTIKYTYISESPKMTNVGLLASMGGSLGMFLGFSVFSFLEVFEICLKILIEGFLIK